MPINETELKQEKKVFVDTFRTKVVYRAVGKDGHLNE